MWGWNLESAIYVILILIVFGALVVLLGMAGRK